MIAEQPLRGRGSGLQRWLSPFRRRPRQTLLLGALLPVLVTVWMPVLRGSAPPAAGPGSAPALATADPTPTKSHPVEAASLAERMERIRGHLGTRDRAPAIDDPFAHDGAAPAPAVTRDGLPDDVRAADLTPTSIALSRVVHPIAIIRGRPYRPGDRIDDFVILAIEERRVLLGRGNDVWAVAIPEPTLGGRGR
jgi:hypothetical protein